MEAQRPLSRPRRHRRARDLARGLCLGALSLALLGPAAALADAASGPGVEFVGPGGTRSFVEPAESRYENERVKEKTCLLRSRPGETPQPLGCGGLPAPAALRSAGIESFGYITVPRPNGTVAYLSANDIEEPSAVYEGEVPPLFSVGGPKTAFYRPPKKDDPDDINAEDSIATVSGEALTVGVRDGNVVEVGVSPSTTSPTSGAPVTFTATASGGKEGEGFTFDWSFGDSSTATGESVSHAFTGSGTYDVRVTAVGSEESGGESGPTQIVVGNPPTTPTPGAATPTQPQTTKPAGAPGKGGKGRGGKSPKPGPGGKKEQGDEAPPTPRDTSPAKQPHRKHPSKPPPATTSPSPEPTPVPSAPYLPTPELPPPLEERSGGDSPEPPGCCSAESPPERSPRQSKSRQNPAPPEGELVEGRLVGDYLSQSPIEAEAAAAGGQGSRSAPGATGTAAGAPVVALIVIALLAAGALFEWRRSRPLR